MCSTFQCHHQNNEYAVRTLFVVKGFTVSVSNRYECKSERHVIILQIYIYPRHLRCEKPNKKWFQFCGNECILISEMPKPSGNWHTRLTVAKPSHCNYEYHLSTFSSAEHRDDFRLMF